MIYTGVPAFGDQPQQFRGETGAQSSVIYAFDAVLGIDHEFDAMRAYLMEMRDYMPVQDRAFIELLEQGPSARTYIAERKATRPSLRDTYNGCIEKLQQFRQLHIEYAALYIIKPAQGAQQGEVGTGGTPFTVYLKKHIQETKSHLL
jgi:indoleamine 2,3-dioxygenase